MGYRVERRVERVACDMFLAWRVMECGWARRLGFGSGRLARGCVLGRRVLLAQSLPDLSRLGVPLIIAGLVELRGHGNRFLYRIPRQKHVIAY